MPSLAIAGVVLCWGASSPFSVREQGRWVKIGVGRPEVVIVAGEGAKENPRQLRTVWKAQPTAPATVLWTSLPGQVKTDRFKTLVVLG